MEKGPVYFIQMKYELEIITDISKTTGVKSKVIVKSAKIRKLFDLDKIDIQVYIDGRTGKEVKKYTGVYENDNYYKVNIPYEQLKNLILNRTSPIFGLMGKSKLYMKRIKCEDTDYEEGLPTPEHLNDPIPDELKYEITGNKKNGKQKTRSKKRGYK